MIGKRFQAILALGIVAASGGILQAQDELPPALQDQSGLDDELLPREPSTPPRDALRVIAGVGGGFSIRLVRNLEFQQERFAPSYFDVFGGVVLPGRGRLRHAATLHVASNLSGDGNYTFGLDPLQQWVLTPAYTARFALQDDPVPDFLLYGRFGVPLALSPDFSWGLELDVGATYMLLAGFGIYVEVGYSMFFGAKDRSGDLTIHPLLSGELGVVFDIEVL